MLTNIFARTDTKWILSTFSVMGFLNLASRMNVVYEGAGVFAVLMALISIIGWIHGIASMARSAEKAANKGVLSTLLLAFFVGGCILATPWHFFAFRDPAANHPGIYIMVQVGLAVLYIPLSFVLRSNHRRQMVRHLVLGYATFSCLFQSVAPKVSTESLASVAGLDLTMAFAGSAFLISVIMVTDAVRSFVDAAKEQAGKYAKRQQPLGSDGNEPALDEKQDLQS